MLLRPRGIAIVGASRREGSVAFRTLRNLVDSTFEGALYPVNPKEEELLGLRCYGSVREIADPVDVALIMVRAAQVESVIEDCGSIGVRVVVVFSSGFAELGEQGRQMQDRIGATARRLGIRVLGPNCQGYAFTPTDLTATFSTPASDLGVPSGIAYVGQSGALGGALVYECRGRGIGLSAWVSTGNQSDLSVTDVALTLLAEPEISVLGIYLEEMPDGHAWEAVLDAASAYGKRVVVLRSGRTDAGKQAAASHTGAMIGSDAAFVLLSRNRGAIMVDDLDEMVDVFAALLDSRATRGERVGIVTTSGGAGSILVDHLHEQGLHTAELRPETTAALGEIVPEFGSVANPVDVTAQLFTADNPAFVSVCRMVADDPGVDHLVVLLTGLNKIRATRVARELATVADTTDTTISFVYMAAPDGRADVDDILHRSGVGVFNSMRDMAVAHGKVRRSATPAPAAHEARPRVEAAVRSMAGVTGSVTEWAGRRFLAAAGIEVPDAVLIDENSVATTTTVSDSLGWGPFALKIQSPDVVHKTEIGGVRIGVHLADVPATVEQIRSTVTAAEPTAEIDGVMIQQMAEPGLELIIGIDGPRDGYPPVLTVGFGGSRAEIYADIASDLCPVTPAGALQLLRSLTAWPLLEGYRGSAPADIDAVVDALVTLSHVAIALDERLVDLEINPFIVREHGAAAVDLVLRLR
ncbi:acetate--CoA ligase family protein [Rhodococcus sp. HM1]|uniref:acetate--CoA ligase family protein n=1 Tax=unclassified Rhodococcus (in: high G+C Gram-positive bacteria) TaxID=192944 RepID=UPI001E2D2F27|nr:MULTISPECIES: acetate--CoA ligase [unclassified Rhodococcus (in: high G+C Gram-positive bacteria)]MCK8671267.1 acetate--CoA ligase family protein [Rhodococcus sp. HM1]